MAGDGAFGGGGDFINGGGSAVERGKFPGGYVEFAVAFTFDVLSDLGPGKSKDTVDLAICGSLVFYRGRVLLMQFIYFVFSGPGIDFFKLICLGQSHTSLLDA